MTINLVLQAQYHNLVYDSMPELKVEIDGIVATFHFIRGSQKRTYNNTYHLWVHECKECGYSGNINEWERIVIAWDYRTYVCPRCGEKEQIQSIEGFRVFHFDGQRKDHKDPYVPPKWLRNFDYKTPV